MENYMRTSRVMFLTLFLLAACLWGCGGGGSGSTVTPAATLTGNFVDGPVQGLQYETSPGGIKGITGETGTYNYLPGDRVTFKIGDLVIGSAPAEGIGGIITPYNLVSYAQPGLSGTAYTVAVTKIVQVLLTLNSNAKPDEGLIIDSTLLKATGFGGIDILNTDLSALVKRLTSVILVDAVTAGAHLEVSMKAIALLAHAGEYIALDGAGNTALFAVVYKDGTVSGSGADLLDLRQVFLLKGNITQPQSIMTDNFALTVYNPADGLVLAEITGKSDGLGTITAKSGAASSSATSTLILHRLTRSKAPYFGVYRGQYLDVSNNPAGVVSFGTDETGALFGWALPTNGDPAVDTYRVTGAVDSKGVISMTGLKSGAQLAFKGTFSTSGNRHFFGNWSGTGSATGTFTVDDINEPVYTVINPATP